MPVSGHEPRGQGQAPGGHSSGHSVPVQGEGGGAWGEREATDCLIAAKLWILQQRGQQPPGGGEGSLLL